MSTGLPGPFIVHTDTVERVHLHLDDYADLRNQDVELPGEQSLHIARTTPPDGPSRPAVVLVHGLSLIHI